MPSLPWKWSCSEAGGRQGGEQAGKRGGYTRVHACAEPETNVQSAKCGGGVAAGPGEPTPVLRLRTAAAAAQRRWQLCCSSPRSGPVACGARRGGGTPARLQPRGRRHVKLHAGPFAKWHRVAADGKQRGVCIVQGRVDKGANKTEH